MLTIEIFWKVPGNTWKVPGEWKWNLAGHPVQIKLKFFYIKKIKRGTIEMGNVWFLFLYRDFDKYSYVGISFFTKIYQFIV